MGRRIEQTGPKQFRAETTTKDGLLVVHVHVVPSPSHLEVDPTTGDVGQVSPESLTQQLLQAASPSDVRTVLRHVERGSQRTTMNISMGRQPSHPQLWGGCVEQGDDREKVSVLARQGPLLPLAEGVHARARVHGHFDPSEASLLVMPSQKGSMQTTLMQRWANGYSVGATTEVLAEIAAKIGGYRNRSTKVDIKVR